MLFSEEIWSRACRQADERLAKQQGSKRKRQTHHWSVATDVYNRTMKSHFDAAMGHQFGGTAWLS